MPAPEKSTIFICHRWSDNQEIVRQITTNLEKLFKGKYEVIFDKNHVTVSPGEPVQEKLHQKLSRSLVFIIIIGAQWFEIARRKKQPSSLNSNPMDYVEKEILHAMNLKNCLIIPCFVESMPNLNSLDYPPKLKRLKALRHLVIGNHDCIDLTELICNLSIAIERHVSKIELIALDPPVSVGRKFFNLLLELESAFWHVAIFVADWFFIANNKILDIHWEKSKTRLAFGYLLPISIPSGVISFYFISGLIPSFFLNIIFIGAFCFSITAMVTLVPPTMAIAVQSLPKLVPHCIYHFVRFWCSLVIILWLPSFYVFSLIILKNLFSFEK